MLTYILLRLVCGVYFSLAILLSIIRIVIFCELWYTRPIGIADVGCVARDLFLALVWPFRLVTPSGRRWLVGAFHLW